MLDSPACTPRIIHETVDDEVLILNLDTGVYYSARQVGAEIWALLNRQLPFDAIVEALARRYASARVATEAAARSFIAELATESLLPATAAAGALGEPSAAKMSISGLPFPWPRLERHSDLKRFLLLYV